MNADSAWHRPQHFTHGPGPDNIMQVETGVSELLFTSFTRKTLSRTRRFRDPSEVVHVCTVTPETQSFHQRWALITH